MRKEWILCLGKLTTEWEINEVRPLPDSIYTNMSKRIKYLNEKNEMIELLGQNIGKCFYNLKMGKEFLSMTWTPQTTKIYRCDYNKIKHFCTGENKQAK